MAYTPDYDETDLSEASVNFIAAVIVGIGTFVTVFLIVFVIGYVRKRIKLG
jgi:hypothetical protein